MGRAPTSGVRAVLPMLSGSDSALVQILDSFEILAFLGWAIIAGSVGFVVGILIRALIRRHRPQDLNRQSSDGHAFGEGPLVAKSGDQIEPMQRGPPLVATLAAIVAIATGCRARRRP